MQDMFAVRKCSGTPRQAWVHSKPGLWPSGSFGAAAPNIHGVGNSTGLCVSGRGGLPGFWAEVGPCQTTFKTKYGPLHNRSVAHPFLLAAFHSKLIGEQ